eukprot:gene12355-biopygen3463
MTPKPRFQRYANKGSVAYLPPPHPPAHPMLQGSKGTSCPLRSPEAEGNAKLKRSRSPEAEAKLKQPEAEAGRAPKLKRSRSGRREAEEMLKWKFQVHPKLKRSRSWMGAELGKCETAHFSFKRSRREVLLQ